MHRDSQSPSLPCPLAVIKASEGEIKDGESKKRNSAKMAVDKERANEREQGAVAGRT